MLVTNEAGRKKGLGNGPEWACSGYVYSLSVADQFIRTGHSKVVLVVAADVLSAFTNWEDRTSCILFGDGRRSDYFGKGE
jgi:3-oxoacyl-[acyl-carrier-protein] synthase-3